MSTARQKRLDRAQMRVLFTVPFFAPGVAKLPVVFDDKVETACTDGKEIRWGTAFFDKLSDQELVTVLCHEVCHCMLGHLWRAPGGCDWDTWNQATDHAVNLMLKEFSGQVMAKRLADPFPFPDPQDAYCADPAYAGLAEEVIYGKLMAKPKNPLPPLPPGKTVSGGSGRSGGLSRNGQGGKTPQKGNSAPNSMPSFGQMSQPKAGSQSSSKKLRNDWEGTLMQACQMAAGRGELLGGMSRFVDGLLKPAVPWYEVLRTFLREQCQEDWDWHKPDPLFDESGFILPSLNSEKIGPVVFGSDWSGSTFGELGDRFHVEKQNALDILCPSKLVDIGFDTRVVFEREYVLGETIEKVIKGGGGTSFVDLFRRCVDMEPAPSCVVVLTDLDGEMPKEAPPFPVLWIVWAKGCQAPFGEVVVAEV